MRKDPWKLLEDAMNILEHTLACGRCNDVVGDEIVRVKKLLSDVLSDEEPTASEVLRILGHELKGPMSALSSLLRTVEEGFASDPEQALALVGRARRRADELVPLVNDILDVGSLSTDSSVMSDAVDLRHVAVGVHHLLTPMMEEGNVRFTLSVPPSSVLVPGTESYLRRVVQNLCMNAFKYNRPGGAVALSLEVEEDQAVLRVSDSGVGIPEADLPHIFGLLYRGKQARRNPDGGLGLGLSLVRQIIEAHGGRISASSVEGEGTVMTVSLPLPGAPPPGSGASTR